MNKQKTQSGASIVAIDVGSVNTRALFLEPVQGRYRFVAAAESFTTIDSPAQDVNTAVLDAVDQLQQVIGRPLMAARGLIISPDQEDDLGVNAVAATFSGGPPIKVVTVGLLESVSLRSVNKLVNSAYCHIVESLSLGDRRKPENIIDTICKSLPDLVVVAGGTNRGASRSVIRLANYLALALKLIPEKSRPALFFVGNENLSEEIENLLSSLTMVYQTSNVRPSLDQESLGPAEQKLTEIYFSIQERKVGGLRQLRRLADGHLMTSAQAFGRVVRFLSTVIDAPKGMLGIDLGGSSTIVASAFAGDLQLRVFPNLGMGSGLIGMIAETPLQHLTRWLPEDVSDDEVLDYLYNKPLSPRALPVSKSELWIETAAARQVIIKAINKSLSQFPASAIYPLAGSLPWLDRILVSGNTVTRCPRLEQSLLMILDSVQPVGIATIILDQNNLAPAIGGAAELDPVLIVQILESSAFLNLGTVISPVGSMRNDDTVLRIQMVHEGQRENVIEVRGGSLQVIPLPPGKVADLYVQTLQNVNIGLGPGRGGWVRHVVGGAFGLIIDTRGRPLRIPTSVDQRRQILTTWDEALTAS